MLGVLTMFAARLGPFYPANHSPREIETKKNRENLQVPAGAVLCLELTDARSRPSPSERGGHVGDPYRERFTTAGRTRAYEHANPKPKELFKTLYDAQPKIRAEIIAKNGKATKY